MRAVSRLSYDDRLRSVDEVTAARTLDGHAPGVRVLTVDHDGNSTESPEEADAIVAEIETLIGATWTDERGTRSLAQDDVLVVAPYNAQVVLLRDRLDAAGLSDGTRGHGRQVPRPAGACGVRVDDGVVHRRRAAWNALSCSTAIGSTSRSAGRSTLSVIVRSPLLTEYLPSTPDRLIDLGAFLSLPSCDRPTG